MTVTVTYLEMKVEELVAGREPDRALALRQLAAREAQQAGWLYRTVVAAPRRHGGAARPLLVLLCLVFLAAHSLLAEPADPTSLSVSPVTDSASSRLIVEYSPPPDLYAKAVAYTSAHYRHYFANAFYAFFVLLLMLRLRLGARYRDWALGASRRSFWQALVYAPLLIGTWALLGSPADVWDQSLERRFGLSVQSWGSWLVDWAINQAIVVMLGSIVVWMLYAIVRRSPRAWWLYVWLASIPLILAVFFLQPLVIQPLFFEFKPLQASHPALLAEIQRVTRRGGVEIPPDRMLEMNASSKLTELNAYVAGFGASKRVVVWDTTLAQASIPETLFIFGHEMGHYVLWHIPQEIAIVALILLALSYLGSRLARWLLVHWGRAWGVRGLDDWASLPVLLLVLSMLGFLSAPAINLVIRHFEREADRYGLEVIHGIVPDANQVAARCLERTGEANLADPDPGWFIEAWLFDHPSRQKRIHFAATYDPWAPGQSPRYVR